jgi:hypothetical protein
MRSRLDQDRFKRHQEYRIRTRAAVPSAARLLKDGLARFDLASQLWLRDIMELTPAPPNLSVLRMVPPTPNPAPLPREERTHPQQADDQEAHTISAAGSTPLPLGTTASSTESTPSTFSSAATKFDFGT